MRATLRVVIKSQLQVWYVVPGTWTHSTKIEVRVAHFSYFFLLNDGLPLPKNRQNASNLVSKNQVFVQLGHGSIHRAAVRFLLKSALGWGMELLR